MRKTSPMKTRQLEMRANGHSSNASSRLNRANPVCSKAQKWFSVAWCAISGPGSGQSLWNQADGHNLPVGSDLGICGSLPRESSFFIKTHLSFSCPGWQYFCRYKVLKYLVGFLYVKGISTIRWRVFHGSFLENHMSILGFFLQTWLLGFLSCIMNPFSKMFLQPHFDPVSKGTILDAWEFSKSWSATFLFLSGFFFNLSFSSHGLVWAARRNQATHSTIFLGIYSAKFPNWSPKSVTFYRWAAEHNLAKFFVIF